MASVINMPATKSFARSETECLPYKNASLPVDERVKDLVDRMTIEEKAGQLFRYVQHCPTKLIILLIVL